MAPAARCRLRVSCPAAAATAAAAAASLLTCFPPPPRRRFACRSTPATDWDPLPEAEPGLNTRSNAALVDSGEAQALSAADIRAMKASGAGGAAILDAVIAGSATFEGKTEFSQAKYK